jgi:putative ABC transport system permease protein
VRGIRAFLFRLTATLRRRENEQDFSDEMESHLQMHIEENRRSGMNAGEARRAALIRLGGIEQTKELLRERGSLPVLEVLLQDTRFALRMLRKNPGFTAVAVLTLALGIGVNTSIFSIAEAFLVHPIALPDLDRLVAITGGEKRPVAPADYLDWKSQNDSFIHVSAYRSDDMSLTGSGEPERVYGTAVDSDFFTTIGLEPQQGRGFAAGEDAPGHDEVVILGHGLWQRRFGADASVLGKSVSVNGKPHTVIGVMGKSVEFPVPTDLWIPLALSEKERAERAATSLGIVAQLKPGANVRQAQAQMSLLARQLSEAYPTTNKDRQVRVMPLVEFVEGNLTREYTVLMLVCVTIVLLVACANVANLQFARAFSRGTEIAVRTALGAPRSRLVRQLLTESVLLALLGGALSLLFAKFCLWLCVSQMPAYVMRLWAGFDKIHLDGAALAFTFVAAILCGALAGILPALGGSKSSASATLREASRGSTAGRSIQRLRSVFVTAQIAVALVLVVGAALLTKGFREMTGSADVYSPERVLTLAVNLPVSRYPQEADRLRFYRKALDSLASVPGAQSVAAFGCYPLSNNGTSWSYFQVEGQVASDLRHSPWAEMQSTSPNYLQFMQVQLEAGREFSVDDRETTQRVAIVNHKLAELYWPKQSALGKRIRIGEPNSSGPWLTVVGVAADVLYDWTRNVPVTTVYQPLTQAPPSATLMGIRTSVDPTSLESLVRSRFASLDPELPAFDVKPLDVAIRESTVGLGYTGAMMGILSLIALAVAMVGIYGVMAHSVGARTREFGVRMAVGARGIDILWLACRQGLFISAAAFAVGVPTAIACARLLAGLVFGTSPGDPSVFVAVPLGLFVAVIFAGFIPARRAMRVDPLVALRYE